MGTRGLRSTSIHSIGSRICRRRVVLVVDDNTMMRTMCVRALETDYQVVACSSAEEALEFLQAHPDQPLDLVLTDIQMPGLSGYDLAQEIHRLRPGVQVRMMTGSTADDPVHVGRETQPSSTLYKPFTFQDLKDFIQELFPTQQSA